MAGEIFIAQQDTLENVHEMVNEIDINVDTINGTTVNTETEISNIKQIVNTILERIGLTTDVADTSSSSLFAKLNALFNSTTGNSEKIVVPSSGKTLYAFNGNQKITSSGVNIISFTPKYNGVLAVKADCTTGNPRYRSYVKVNNTTVLASQGGGISIDMNQIGYFNIIKGTSYSIKVINSDSTSKYYGNLRTLVLCGEVINKNILCEEF